MKKTILSILLAVSAASPVLAAQVVPQGQQAEQKDSVKLISLIAVKPVYVEPESVIAGILNLRNCLICIG